MLEGTTRGLALLAASLLTGSLLFASAAGLQKTPVKPVDFIHDIEPLLRASCVQCHGPKQQAGGLRLDNMALALKGGTGGKAILPGRGAQSLLVQRIEGRGGKPRMPLGFAPLPPEKIALIRAWIDQGANWPERAALRKHWAYIKPVRPKLPPVKNRAWARNPIDAFILARLERAGLRPSPEAPRETLVRRVYLDLIGLPPAPKEVDAFLADKSHDAYEKVVDRLLNSPHYGERWARLWLDLARYADSNGFEKDNSRVIWPYRDWVIRALNQDMPFDQFTIEQIAGDLLPDATTAQKVATGFHRNTMLNEEGGVDREEQRWLTIIDRVNTTATVWLGTTFGCAQCHDHKFDPFTMQDYYRFFAFFDGSSEPTLDLTTPENAAKRKALQAEIAETERQIKAGGMEKAAQDSARARLEELRKQLTAVPAPTTLVMEEKQSGEPPSTYFRVKGMYLSKGEKVTAAVPAALHPFPPGRSRNRLGLAYWLVDPQNPLTARVTVNRLWEQLFGRGLVETSEDFGTQGQRPTHPDLLDWLAVTLVEKGSEGVREYRGGDKTKIIHHSTTPPLHHSPRFACGWSLKRLLSLIVTSATYRQASRITPTRAARDPYNRLYARGPRFRLEAEMVRDVSLEAAGLLSHKIGGPSVFPLQPEGIWDIPYSGERWVTSPGEDRYRRGLYTFWRRSAPYPAFLTFDATSREFCAVRRVRTNTPLQALTTLNDPAFFEAARGLALRMWKEGGPDIAARIAYGFRCCVARKPRAKEQNRLAALYQQQRQRYQADPKAAQTLTGLPADTPDLAEKAALTIAANVMLNLDETLTKE